MPGGTAEFNKRCGQIKSGELQKGIDMMEDEIDEYAEGVDAVQKDQAPATGWDEAKELEEYMKRFEN